MTPTIYDYFLELSKEERLDGKFRVKSINEPIPYTIGCSLEGYPVFFIESTDFIKTSDIKLEMFHVMFNRKCNISNIDTEQEEVKLFNVVQLNTLKPDLQKYFFEVMSMVLSRLKAIPETLVLKSEIAKIIQLFTKPNKLSLDVVRGLWAELLVIEQSKEPSYLIKSWHVTPNDKYDFNDGEAKIEVKSSKSLTRKHFFSLDQLLPDSELLVASIFVIQTGIGKSIFDLIEHISIRVQDSELLITLREIVWTTIGPSIEEASKLYFDYNCGVESYNLYNYRDIPSISKSAIPIGVENVTFISDLAGCLPINYEELSKSEHTIFNSI